MVHSHLAVVFSFYPLVLTRGISAFASRRNCQAKYLRVEQVILRFAIVKLGCWYRTTRTFHFSSQRIQRKILPLFFSGIFRYKCEV